MKKELSLNGSWNVKGFGPQGEELSLTANVPGMIHLDLEREGIIPPMFWRDNAEQCQWVENWSWEYSRTFTVEEDTDLRYSVLEFEGLDTYADITLNGKKLGSTANAQIPHEFRVRDFIHPGENTISIFFTPYQQHIQGKRMDYVAAFNRSDRVHVRRMQCTFYWDWVGRFVTFGPWRPVTLHFYDEARIRSLFVWTHDIVRTSASLRLQLETEMLEDLVGEYTPRGNERPPETARFGNADNDQVVYCSRPTYVNSGRVEILNPNGELVWDENFNVFNPCIHLQADLADPELWWPVPYGSQPLYTVKFTLFAPDGRVVDERTHRFGIRTVRVEQLRDKPGSEEEKRTLANKEHFEEKRSKDIPGTSFVLLVNGERIMCSGGNWVPADPFPCRITREKYRRLVSLAAQGNLNLLRVWGGGIYESDDFLEACDEMGVMLTYDFQLACARFPEDDEEWVENFKDEFPKAVRRLRNHPAIVWYCGDNENACHYDWDDPGAPGVRLLREVYYPGLAQLDPSRPFFPTSPWNGRNNEATTRGDCHHGPYYRKEDMPRRILRYTTRLASECATQGSSLFSTLLEFMTEEDLADPEVKMFDYHVKDNPHKPEGDPTLYIKSRRVSENLLGAPKNTEDKILKDAYCQYFWNKEAVEAYRRHRWYSSGIQFWMYNDCWPTTGLAMVDWFQVPKGGYFGSAQASKPIIVTFEETDSGCDVIVCNDTFRDEPAQLRLYLQEHTGRKYELEHTSFISPANRNLRVTVVDFGKLPVPLDASCQLVAEISGSFGTHRNLFAGVWPKELVFPAADLKWELDEEKSTITLHSEQYVHGVIMDIRGRCSDNFFDLLPGETRVISVEPYEGHQLAELQVYWLNRE